jgi:tetratricopeptide (TPR) repeat protein
VLDLRATAYRQMGNDDSARDQYLALIALDSLDQGALIFLASYYQRRSNIDSTIWAYSRLRLVQPGNFQLLNELGRLQVMGGQMSAARSTFRQSLEIQPFPVNAQAFFSLAELFELSRLPDSVFAVLNEGLQKDPDNISLHNELVTRYVRSDSLSRALPHMRAIARINSGDPEVSRRLAMLLMGLDSLAQADSIFTTLVDRGQSTYTDHYSLGMIAAVSDNMPRAKAELRHATQLDRTKLEAWLNLAAVFNALNQPDSARRVYLEGAENMREEAAAIQLYFALGASLEQADLVDSAILIFEEILTHQPDHDQTLNYLGYMLADRNLQLEYAHRLIRRALTLQPNNAAYLDSYGWVHYRLGNYDSALVYLKSASDIDSDPVILDHLGDAYQASGDAKKAREVWEAVLRQQPDNQAVREKLQP